MSSSKQPPTGRASGHGIATISGTTVLDVWFPNPTLGKLSAEPDKTLTSLAGVDEIRKVKREIISIEIDLALAPQSAADAYLRLHLLSHRLIKPHGAVMDGIFGLLANVVWTTAGPCALDGFEEVRAGLRAKYGHVTVFSVDKFPRMVDYVIPSGVRIADADRVRLGAYLATGTTVMHEGFVNFNAGTLGTSMVEGRISSGVVVGDGSDVGGGASIMGTLSGGGKEVISVGEKCLLGANSGLGISLGNNCVIEAGTYITAAAKVRLPDGEIVKAGQLSGANDLLFRRNSLDGSLEVVVRTGTWGGLNSILHAN
ncbi:2,3,4,5-tetrahydropyridine-2,6-dicarboxylate N-succinyltransferase [Actinobacteria bacterium IMCC26103]|nr:2,3,4,5-tetrahydropyridine-2,6-dicarboxylate N-succinyltransferase [Actinobacteria bacterium IMCC26103]